MRTHFHDKELDVLVKIFLLNNRLGKFSVLSSAYFGIMVVFTFYFCTLHFWNDPNLHFRRVFFVMYAITRNDFRNFLPTSCQIGYFYYSKKTIRFGEYLRQNMPVVCTTFDFFAALTTFRNTKCIHKT